MTYVYLLQMNGGNGANVTFYMHKNIERKKKQREESW